MVIGVLKEQAPETRVSLVPEVVAALVKMNVSVYVEPVSYTHLYVYKRQVRYNIFNLNFAYLIPSGSGVTRNPLSNTLRFSLMFEFDDLKKKEGEVTP